WGAWARSVSSGRKPRTPGQTLRSARSSSGPLLAPSRRRTGVHGARLVDRWAADLLLQARPLVLLVGPELDRLAAARRAVQRADHAHVGQAFLRPGFRLMVLEHAVGEVKQLGRELIALREAPLLPFAADGEAVLQRHRVLVGGLEG